MVNTILYRLNTSSRGEGINMCDNVHTHIVFTYNWGNQKLSQYAHIHLMRVGLNSLHQQDLRTTLYINQIEENAENSKDL